MSTSLDIVRTNKNLVFLSVNTHLKYAYLGEQETFPVIIASHLNDGEEEDLKAILRKYKEAIGWTMTDIKGLSPAIVQHRIHLNEKVTPKRDPQRRLNPIIQSSIPFLIANGSVLSTRFQKIRFNHGEK